MSKTKSNTGIYITLLLFLSLGLCYSYYTPLWCPPDEERHFVYCEYIAQNHRLPDFKYDPEKNIVHMGYQAPLYYLFGSLFCKDDGKLLEEEIFVNDRPGFINISHPKEEIEFPYSGKARTAHLLRIFSLLLSAVNIYFIYLLVLAIFPGETILASATALFVATIPQFLHTSASVSNENMGITLSTVYLFVLLRYLNGPVKVIHHMVTGVLLGCCLLSKITTIFYLPVTVCVFIFAYFRDKKSLIESFLVVFCTAALVAGWWYLRNWLVSNDPFLTKTVVTLHPWFLRRIPLSLNDWGTIIVKTFISFFGYFGSLQFSIQRLHLFIYGCIMLLGIVGLCYLSVKGKMTAFQGKALGMLFLSFLGGTGIFTFLNIKYVGSFMGRYLFVVIAPIAIITFIGLRYLFTQRWRNPVFIVLSISLIILNLDVFFRVLKPTYDETSLTVSVDQPIFSYPTAEIEGTTTITQTLISPKNNLSAIRVMFSNLNKPKSGEITFSLREKGDNEKVLRQINFPLKKINDCTRYFFIFPPIENSMGKDYMFYFSSPSLPSGHGVSLWHESNDVYPGGEILVNGEPAVGDLYFTAYHSTGEYPKTDWQGKREIVINHGPYISIREFQLYNERSREFREKTITHEKILHIKKVLNNRKSLRKHK